MSNLKIYFLLVLTLLFSIACNRQKNEENRIMERIREGEKLFPASGCIMCHSLKGEKLYGPKLNSILKKEITVIRKDDTLSLIVDKEYLRRAIADPDYEKLIGFESSKMTKPILSDEKIDALVEYLIYINEKKEK